VDGLVRSGQGLGHSGYLLVDREGGRVIGLSFWESPEDLEAAEAETARMRADPARQAVRGVVLPAEPKVDVFEVVFRS
jgi:hypothetical protein